MQAKRQHIISDFIVSEAHFLGTLQLLNKYYTALANNPQLIPHLILKQVFANLEQIYNIHVTLETRLSHIKKSINDEAEETLARTLIAIAPFFKAYSEFIADAEVRFGIVKTWEEKPEIAAILKTIGEQSVGKESLEEALVRPLNRISCMYYFSDISLARLQV